MHNPVSNKHPSFQSKYVKSVKKENVKKKVEVHLVFKRQPPERKPDETQNTTLTSQSQLRLYPRKVKNMPLLTRKFRL